MRIARKRHAEKGGRLLVWEETPGASSDGPRLSALKDGGVALGYPTKEHLWTVILTKEEFNKLKAFEW